MFTYNGLRVRLDKPFVTDDGTQYPPNWFNDPGARAKVGIIEIDDPVRESDKLYYVTEIDEAPYIINTPKPTEIVNDERVVLVLEQITEIERNDMIPRNLREYLLTQAPVDTPLYQQLKNSDDKIIALRKQL